MERGDIYLSALLKEYEQRYAQEAKELKGMPEGTLTFRNTKGKTQYVRMFSTSSKAAAATQPKAAAATQPKAVAASQPKAVAASQPKAVAATQPKAASTTGGMRIGITKDEILVGRLARKKYLQISTQLLSEEIKRLRKYIEKRTEPSPDSVFERMSENWQKVPKELLLPHDKEREKWAEAEYRKNGKEPDKKVHTTSRGLKVRSKSELLIAESLYHYNIPFRYEEVISNDRYLFSPDFIIKTSRGLIYWEHCGKMAEKGYRDYNKWKLSQYERMEIVPWNNLIITYDINDGEFDMRIIKAEIVNKLLEQ